MKILISEEKLKSFCEKILNHELELYKKELDKIDYSFEGLELFDEVAKKIFLRWKKLKLVMLNWGKM